MHFKFLTVLSTVHSWIQVRADHLPVAGAVQAAKLPPVTTDGMSRQERKT